LEADLAEQDFSPPRVARFGLFEADFDLGELRREGRLVPLQEHPFLVLTSLLENPGHEISREHLRRLLWPDQEFLDFENGINTAVGRLRQALGDSAENPRFIATRRGHGYRFVAPVTWLARESSEEGGAAQSMSPATYSPAVHVAGGRIARAPGSEASALGQAFGAPTARERLWMGTSVLLLAFLLVTLGFAFSSRRSLPVSGDPMRFPIFLPDNMSLASDAVLAPDGQRIAFAARGPSGTSVLMVRAFTSSETRILSDTEGASNPFWSPDSQWIGFFAEGKLKRVGLSGEAPRTLAHVGPRHRTGTWSRDGIIVFAADYALYRVGAEGGIPVSVTTLDVAAGEVFHDDPFFLPDGRHVVYSIRAKGIFVGSIHSSEKKQLLDGASSRPCYVPSGQLLFVREGVLLGQPFDANRQMLSAEATALIEGVATFSAASNGTLAYTRAGATRLMWFDRAGRQLDTVPDSDGLGNPALSLDETQVAANRRFWGREGQTVWFADIKRRLITRFTADTTSRSQPLWSPDGKSIAYTSGGDLFSAAIDGTRPQLLLRTSAPKFLHDWSRDGRYVVYSSLDPTTKLDLWLLPTFGDGKPVPHLRTTFNELAGQISADGRWIAYESDESGSREIYLESFPTPGSKRRASNNGGTEPRWRRDGRELFYLAPDRKLMAVDVRVRGGLDLGTPRVLFQTNANTVGRNSYALTSDGQRFLIETRNDPVGSAPVTVVLNWTALLNRYEGGVRRAVGRLSSLGNNDEAHPAPPTTSPED
jgi:Tol biopolymer transport system component/DNA-binding winged helix-turn-helix (wHTH) protein